MDVDAFGPQLADLRAVARRAFRQRDPAPGTDDPKPGQAQRGRGLAERATDLAGATWQASELRNFAIGGHAPCRNSGNDTPD